MHGKGRDGPADKAAGLQRFLEGCEHGAASGCHNAGLLLKGGSAAVPADPVRAHGLFEQACGAGEANGCFYVGLNHLVGVEGVSTCKDSALEAFAQACRLGHAWGCQNASVMCSKGEGVPVDEKRATFYRDQYARLKQQGA